MIPDLTIEEWAYYAVAGALFIAFVALVVWCEQEDERE